MFALQEIYDAAFDRALFPKLLERLVASLGAQAGFIGWSDLDRDAGFQTQFGNDPAALQSYIETYAPHDILRPHLHAVPEGVCAPAWDLLQTPEVRESIFYRKYLAPQGIVDNLAVNLIKRPGIVAHLALLRREPAARFSEEECARLAEIVPHLRRAIYIQSHVVRAADHAAGEQAMAGIANSALLLLGADRTLLDADASLIRLLRLRIGEPIGQGVVGTAVARALENAEPVALEMTPSEEDEPVRLLVEVRPLDMNRFGDLAGGPGAAYAVHVTRVDRPRVIAFAAIGSLFGLTATELRVLRDAIEAGDITAVGDRLGMARATARTHLHRIYEKTETRSFAGLSNLAHRFGRIAT
jgi:DNA-binding CsgD family transcriptional regulator